MSQYSKFPKQLPPLPKKNETNELQDPFNQRKVQFEDQQDEREQEELELPPNHDSGLTHNNYLSDNRILTCFPFSNRISVKLSRLFRCQQSNLTFVDELIRLESNIYQVFDISSTEQDAIRDKSIILKVLSTSQLQMDTNMTHPFVKIHVVNMKTGCYILKPKKELKDIPQQYNAVYNFETNCIINIIDGEKDRKTCELELVVPFATNCTDMTNATNSRAVWNEEILINIPSELFFNSENVILFELLDFHPQLLAQQNTDQLDKDHFYRIAWGFLRPMGLSKLHLGITKIQLYKYLFDSQSFRSSDRRESIPLVYYDFIWPFKVNYDAILSVFLDTQPQPRFIDVFEKSLNVYQIERGDKDIKSKLHHTQNQQIEEAITEEVSELEKRNLRRRRFATDKSDQIPDKIAFKFASAQLGCYRLTFNKQGNYLAAACTFKNSKTIIKIFDVEIGTPFVVLKGHRNIVHDLKFSQNSKYLLTSSSDYTCKVWLIPQNSSEIVQEDESEILQICTLQHPSYVYSAIFLTDSSYPLIVTACFDSRIRIWQVDTNELLLIQDEPLQQEVISRDGIQFDQSANLLEHRHPNCIVYDGQKCLYVGDSLGSIHFFDINLSGGQYIARRLALICNMELEGDPINSINIMPPEYQDLLVHSRDNCVRVVDFKSAENKYQQEMNQSDEINASITTRFFGTVTQRVCIRSVPSPKGEYVLSGSEDGRPHLWNNLSQSLPVESFQYNLMGSVTDVAWNENYHMIALAGFGDEHPIVIYVWERQGDMNFIEAKKLQDESKFQQRQQEEIEFNFQNTQTMKQTRQFSNSQGLFHPQSYQQSQKGPFGVFTQPPGEPFGGGPFGDSYQPPQQEEIIQPFGDSNYPPPKNQPNTPFNNNNNSDAPFG